MVGFEIMSRARQQRIGERVEKSVNLLFEKLNGAQFSLTDLIVSKKASLKKKNHQNGLDQVYMQPI